MEKTIHRLFVSEISVNSKQLRHQEELHIIDNVRDSLLHFILEETTAEAKEKCCQIIREVTGGKPIKGNIIYTAEPSDDDNEIEIVRNAHGGGNNASLSVTGGVIIATIKIVSIRGELSPIHGTKWYNLQEGNPFIHLFR